MIIKAGGQSAVADGAAGAFSDLSGSAWAADFINAASDAGIVSGYKDGTFRPKNNITRQELTVILYNYSGRPEVSGSLDAVFADHKQIAGWAADAVLWAYQNGVVSGIKTDNTLQFNPRGNATRAEAAAMMKNFMQ